jgi:phospholipase/carboxylesterase
MANQAAMSLTHRVAPARQAVDGPAPGLLLLHGRGADELDLLGLAGALDPRLTVISARAPFALGPGYHWYEFLDLGTPEPTSHAAARARLEAFIDEATAAYALDPARLYVLGFSQGAVMTGGLALTMPGRLGGALLLSGYLPPATDLTIDAAGLRGLPIFAAHGRYDDIIPVQYGRQTRDTLTQLGAALTYREYPIPHTISEPELADIAAWLATRLQGSRIRGQGSES